MNKKINSYNYTLQVDQFKICRKDSHSLITKLTQETLSLNMVLEFDIIY